MSKCIPPLRKKDKAIRLSASAAICGLTVSFLISESIAARLRDPTEFFSSAPEQKIALSVLQPVLAFHSLVEQVELPSLSPLFEEPMRNASTPTLFASLRARGSHLSELTKPLQAESISQTSSAPVDILKVRAAAPALKLETENRKLRGKIVGAEEDVGGYFEVGIYGKIDAAGNPIGYPLVQQILPSHIRSFALEKLPGLERGYLFARLVKLEKTIPESARKFFAYPQNPLIFSKPQRLVELEIPVVKEKARDSVSAISAATAKEKKALKGLVGAMFSKRGSFLPVSGAEVKIRGTATFTTTNARGEFKLDVTDISGDILLEFLKPGYLPSIRKVSLSGMSESIHVEIASKDAIDQMAYSLGIRQSATKSVLLGFAKNKDGKPLQGLTLQTSLRADGPYYFSTEGYPSGSAGAIANGTSSDGRFLLFNVEAGTGVLEAAVGGESIAPAPISAVEGGGLIFKELEPVEQRIRGRLFNPVQSKNGKPQAVVGARVKVEGSSEWTTTDVFGAFELPNLRYLKGEDIPLEMMADKFYNHRYQLKFGINYVDLFAFPSLYISGLANSVDVQLDPYASIVLGSLGRGKSLRVDALADHSSKNGARDFYFGANQVIKGSYAQTDARFGTFVLFNVPRGRTLLQGLDNAGKLRVSKILHTHPSTINIILE